MAQQHPGRVQDYTTANMILIFVNLMWIFGVLWAQWGLGAVMIVAAGLNYGISRLAVHRATRAALAIRRGKSGYEEA